MHNVYVTLVFQLVNAKLNFNYFISGGISCEFPPWY